MPYHAIVLARENWIKAASEGKVKIYDFPKDRRPEKVRKLELGSICIVMKYPSPQFFMGEFVVREVRKLNAREYEELKRFIHAPQELKPGEEVWAIFFDEFTKYPRPLLRAECKDIKTASSRKPLSDWAIPGLTLIKPTDYEFIQAIRKKAGMVKEEVLTHNAVRDMLYDLGKMLDFVAKVEEPTPSGAYKLDVTWRDYEGHAPLKVFEVEASGSVDLALSRLADAHDS